jgi:hypothetical protein
MFVISKHNPFYKEKEKEKKRKEEEKIRKEVQQY